METLVNWMMLYMSGAAALAALAMAVMILIEDE